MSQLVSILIADLILCRLFENSPTNAYLNTNDMAMTRLRRFRAGNFPYAIPNLPTELKLDPLQGLKQGVIHDDTTADGWPGKVRKVTPGSASTTCNEEEIEQVLCLFLISPFLME